MGGQEAEAPVVRLGFEEAFQLTKLSDGPSPSSSGVVHKFMSRQPSWCPGGDLKGNHLKDNRGFGGHVYAQAPLAAARVVEQEDKEAESNGQGKRSLHSIQGVFTNPGLVDRPFVYEVSNISSSRSFSTRLVNARQPREPSSTPLGPFPLSDQHLPMADVCFTCLVTFKRHLPPPDDLQVPISPQERFADILSQRKPDEWEPSPSADIDLVKEMFPQKGHGEFPVLDMYKVDMSAFNADKPPTQRVELILYRLLKPIPKEDVNAHIVCHANVADRNGLIMLGNHLGYGHNLGSVASLSYAFYVHTNAEEAVMHDDGWWLEEVNWTRISAGRAMQECRIWSPEGKHVATGYQDGLLLPGGKRLGRQKKL